LKKLNILNYEFSDPYFSYFKYNNYSNFFLNSSTLIINIDDN